MHSHTSKMTLRPYQLDCISAIEQSTARRRAVVIPTGGGKTVLFASYALQNNLKALVVAHRIELIRQTQENLSIIKSLCSCWHRDG